MYSSRQEPFPLLEGRLAALCQQLGESVVTAPGMATTQMIVTSLGFQRMSKDVKRYTTFHFRHCVIKSYKVNIKVIDLIVIYCGLFPIGLFTMFSKSWRPIWSSCCRGWYHQRRRLSQWGGLSPKTRRPRNKQISAVLVWNCRCFSIDSFYVFHSDRAKKQ